MDTRSQNSTIRLGWALAPGPRFFFVFLLTLFFLYSTCSAANISDHQKKLLTYISQYKNQTRSGDRLKGIKAILKHIKKGDGTDQFLSQIMLKRQDVIPDLSKVKAELQVLNDKMADLMHEATNIRSAFEANSIEIQLRPGDSQNNQLLNQNKLYEERFISIQEESASIIESQYLLIQEVRIWNSAEKIELPDVDKLAKYWEDSSADKMKKLRDAYEKANRDDIDNAINGTEEYIKQLDELFSEMDKDLLVTMDKYSKFNVRIHDDKEMEKIEGIIDVIKGNISESRVSSDDIVEVIYAPPEKLDFLQNERKVELFTRSAKENIDEATRLRKELKQLADAARERKSSTPDRLAEILGEMEDISDQIGVLERRNWSLWDEAYKLPDKTDRLYSMVQDLLTYDRDVKSQARMATEYLVDIRQYAPKTGVSGPQAPGNRAADSVQKSEKFDPIDTKPAIQIGQNRVKSSIEAALKSTQMNIKQANRLRQDLDQLVGSAKSANRRQFRALEAKFQDIYEIIDILSRLNQSLWEHMSKFPGGGR